MRLPGEFDLRRLSLLAAALVLVSCGGGGGGGGGYTPPPPPPPPSGPSGPVYTPGVFEPASDFKNLCEAPRSGFDIEGNPYPDMAGSTVEENFWLRSWTHETYLWNDEVEDRDPYDYSDPIDYFDLMKTFAVAPSGADKDNFHFTEPTEEYLEARNSEPVASYGVQFVSFGNTPPRDFRVLYTDPDTPATEQSGGRDKFLRGARILEIDGVDFLYGSDVDTLNAGLTPQTADEIHTFTMRDPDGTERSFSITSADISSAAVNRTATLDTATGKVGYMLFNTFGPYSSEAELLDAITAFDAEGIDDLVLDLRYNGGGLLAVASELGYMIAGPVRTDGKTFEQLQFNDDAGSYNPVTGERNDPVPFYDEAVGFSVAAGTNLPDLDLSRVFILATDWTCSASESVINSLRGIGLEVVLIGDTTCGKPYGFYPTDNCGTTYYTIQFQGVNDVGFGDYPDGFTPSNSGDAYSVSVPGCQALDDLDNELGDPAEAMLAAALQYREDRSCPTAPVTASSAVKASESASTATGANGPAVELPRRRPGLNNRDMQMPEGERL